MTLNSTGIGTVIGDRSGVDEAIERFDAHEESSVRVPVFMFDMSESIDLIGAKNVFPELLHAPQITGGHRLVPTPHDPPARLELTHEKAPHVFKDIGIFRTVNQCLPRFLDSFLVVRTLDDLSAPSPLHVDRAGGTRESQTRKRLTSISISRWRVAYLGRNSSDDRQAESGGWRGGTRPLKRKNPCRTGVFRLNQ